MELQEAYRKIAELEGRKKGLIEELLEVFRVLRRKGYEVKAITPYLREKERVRAGPLRRQVEELEFRIATEAYTPADEREFIKVMKAVERELGDAIKVERVRKRKGYIEGDLRRAEEGKARIEGELAAIRKELRELREWARLERERGRERRIRDAQRRRKDDARQRKRRELEPFMKPLDDLTLEQVVVIERKGK